MRQLDLAHGERERERGGQETDLTSGADYRQGPCGILWPGFGESHADKKAYSLHRGNVLVLQGRLGTGDH